MGRPVITLEDARRQCKNFLIVICSDNARNYPIMWNLLQNHPIEGAVVCSHNEYALSRHADEVLHVYDLLEDAFSKATYAHMVMFRLGKCPRDQAYTLPIEEQYFSISPFEKMDPNEVFVDCGAFVGDTLEHFVWKRMGTFQKYFAFEPSEKTCQALKHRVERLNNEWGLNEDAIIVVPSGIGEGSYITDQQLDKEEKKMVSFCLAQHGGISVCSIDDYFAEQAITTLKADIEGFEEKMLDGAEKTIRRDHPKLALCIYHRPEDLFRLPLKVKNFYSRYHFAIRQHSFDYSETILYAYAEE